MSDDRLFFERLDKVLSYCTELSRRDVKNALRSGRVFLNGAPAKDASVRISDCDELYLDEKRIEYRPFTYIMLNKPEGYVSSTDDPSSNTVLELLDIRYKRKNLFSVGRLDKNTVGLLLITDNGELAHSLLSPKKHVAKKYFFKCEKSLKQSDIEAFSDGVALEDGYITKPALLEICNDGYSGFITVTEGKFHQIKRMLIAVGNKVTFLERVEFASLKLDTHLKRGEYRELTESEAESILGFF